MSIYDHVVVDVEIQKPIESCTNGWDSTEEMGVAVATLWEYRTSRLRIYGPEDMPALQKRLLQADRISGYNIHRFDFPVIWGLSKQAYAWDDAGVALRAQLRPKTDDLLRRIWLALGLNPDTFSRQHGGWKLDTVAASTLGVCKIGQGEDAPRWYQAGQVQRVANYCADDVCLERDLCDFIERYGYVLNGERILRIPLWRGI